MIVREIMTAHVDVIHPENTLEEAARKMKALDVGLLPVHDGERVVGMLSDRDIAVRSVAQGEDPTRDRVADVMTHDVVYCFDDQPIAAAASLMKEHQIRRLLVVDRNHKLAGIVSLGDVAVETGDDRLAGNILERVSEPAQPNLVT